MIAQTAQTLTENPTENNLNQIMTSDPRDEALADLRDRLAADDEDNSNPGTEASPLTGNQMRVTDNLSQLLDILPPPLRAALEQDDHSAGLIEIVMDLGP